MDTTRTEPAVDLAPDLSPALRLRRRFVIAAAALSGLLVFVSMIVDPVPDADGVDLVVGYAENLTASGLHTNLIHYGFALTIPVAFAIVGLVRGRGAVLANLAGLLAILGLTSLPGLVMLDFYAVAALRATDVETVAAIEREMEGLTWFIAIIAPAGLAMMVAMSVAVLALWRAGLAPWPVAVGIVAASLAPSVGLPWWLGFGANALGMLALAYVLASVPMHVWYPSAARSEDRSGAPVGR